MGSPTRPHALARRYSAAESEVAPVVARRDSPLAVKVNTALRIAIIRIMMIDIRGFHFIVFGGGRCKFRVAGER